MSIISLFNNIQFETLKTYELKGKITRRCLYIPTKYIISL